MSETDDKNNNLENKIDDDKDNFQWFLLKCIGGNEHIALRKLRSHSQFFNYFQDDFIILRDYESVEESKIGKKKHINVFSGYFFGIMKDEGLARNILRSCGISIVKPYKSRDEINKLIDKIKEQSNLSVNKNFSIREIVKVDMGIINGEGTIISINEEKHTAMVEIFCFGSYTSVNVPFENIEKVKNF